MKITKGYKALIFGINGQDGWYLKNLLLAAGLEVIGVSRNNPEYTVGDVSDTMFVTQLIKGHQPEYIFHLAANSNTRHDSLFENYQSISTGSVNILEAVYKYSKQSKVFISGSGLQFVNSGIPISETDPFEARDSYSMARIQSAYAARYYRSLGIKTYIGYFFNHDSPRRPENHVNQKIVRAVQRIGKGSDEVLELGNIDVLKEFNFAGDVVEAIWKLVNQEVVWEAVIGTGKAYSIKDWVVYCFDKIGVSWDEFVVIKKGFIPDYKGLISSPGLIYSLGWLPKVDFYQLADMMMNDY